MFTLANLAATLAFLRAAVALPNGYKQPSPVQHQPYPTPTPTPQYNIFSYNANFDDITAIPLVGADVQQIGVYKSLLFQGFNLDQVTLQLGIIPNSPSNNKVYKIGFTFVDANGLSGTIAPDVDTMKYTVYGSGGISGNSK